jgi:hypothetical protein
MGIYAILMEAANCAVQTRGKFFGTLCGWPRFTSATQVSMPVRPASVEVALEEEQ